MIQCFHQRVITGVPRFFPKIELRRSLRSPERSSLRSSRPRGDEAQKYGRRGTKGGMRGEGKVEILKMASRTDATAHGNSRANFEGPSFPRRGTSTAAENYPARTTQSSRGRPISWPWANRVQTVPLGGANCASPLSYLREVDLSIKRLLPGRARTPRRAASRIKLEGVSSPL